MKIIFFDADKRTREFYKGKKFGKAKVEFISGGPSGTENDADAISATVRLKLDIATLKKFPNLRLIATRSTGFNHIDIKYCRKREIKIANVVGYGETAVAEFAMGLLLCLMRKIFIAAGDLRAGRVDMPKYEGRDISGKTIGVFGTGAIGSRFVKLAHAFGAKIIAHDRSPNPNLDGIAEYVDLDTLYGRADIVALNIPANESNYHIVNAAAIAKMKRGVLILNIARGELINAAALYKALLSGQVGGVAMDVLELENAAASICGAKGLTKDQAQIALYNEKMLDMDNVLITPHTAFNSIEANKRILQATQDTLKAFAEGGKFKVVSA